VVVYVCYVVSLRIFLITYCMSSFVMAGYSGMLSAWL